MSVCEWCAGSNWNMLMPRETCLLVSSLSLS